MREEVKIIECPRDAWQGLSKFIPTDVKVDYLAALLEAGFRRIDAVSFVSPSAVPQMADSEEVLKRLAPPGDVEIIGIVMNQRGAERAIGTGIVRWLGFPYSASPTFAMRNQRQTPEQSLQQLTAICRLAMAARIHVVAYLSMAFGNPYGDPWDAGEVLRALRQADDAGVGIVSLADTVGMAKPQDVAQLLEQANTAFPHADIGVHLHSRPERALEKFFAAYDAGCRRFDSSVGGLGGCPFAQDDRVGNMPTEELLSGMAARGISSPVSNFLQDIRRRTAEIAATYG